jgi:hypothetical protein
VTPDDLRTRLREMLDTYPHQDEEWLAEHFLAGCDKADLLPLVVDAFRHLVRRQVREIELSELAGRKSRRSAAAISDFAHLLDLPYRIGDGVTRSFGQLTAEQHRTRVLLLRGQQAGIERAITLHERAIALIEANEVECLDDLPTEVAA